MKKASCGLDSGQKWHFWCKNGDKIQVISKQEWYEVDWELLIF